MEMGIPQSYMMQNERLRKHPTLAPDDRTGYTKVTFELGGTINEPTDSFRTVMEMNGGGARKLPPSDQENDALWKALLEDDPESERPENDREEDGGSGAGDSGSGIDIDKLFDEITK